MRSTPALLLGLVAVPVRDAGAAHRLNAKPSPLRVAPAAATRAASGGLARAACALRGGGESFFGDLYDFSDQAGSAAARPRRASAPRGARPSLGLPAGLLWFAVKSLSLIAVAGSGVFVGRSTAREDGTETMYAESVAELEARLHRLSVDRQMLQDEFADARRALERQVEEATRRAAAGQSETGHALEGAKREVADARAASASLAKRASATAAELDAARADADEARRQLEAEKRVRQADGDQLLALRAELEALRAAADAEGAEGERRGAKITGLEGELLAAKARGDGLAAKLAEAPSQADLDAARADAADARKELGEKVSQARKEFTRLEAELGGAKARADDLAAKLAAAPPRGGLGGPADQLAAVKKKKKQPSPYQKTDSE